MDSLMVTVKRIVLSSLCVAACILPASAQTTASQSESEDVEPRIIGAPGTTLIGISGFADHFLSRSRDLPLNYSIELEVAHFVSRRVAAYGGLSGAGSLGGDVEEEVSGVGASALHLFGGGRVYFTPQSMASVYAAADYWTQVTDREDGDAGSIVGKIGGQAAISSRASVFAEAGYGIGLTALRDGRVVRMLARIGVRFKW